MNRLIPRTRSGWVKYALLAVLAAAGWAGGLYLSGARPSAEPVARDRGPGQPDPPAPTQRYPLTALDARETMEAPELAADTSGRVVLVWASQTGPDARVICLARAEADGVFGAPEVVARSGVFRFPSTVGGRPVAFDVKLAPHVRSDGSRLNLAWTEALADGSGVRTVTAVSSDGGGSFSPHRVASSGPMRSAFTALAVGPNGTVACAWLGNRGAGQHVLAAVLPPEGTAFGAERLVHAGQDGRGVCPCCATAVAFATDGTLYVAFRDLKDGYRDIAVCRLRPGQAAFEGPFPVVERGWKFDGCPHDGPSLAVVGDRLHVAWMDGRTGRPRCYHAAAGLADLMFSAPHPLGGEGPGTQGNPKLHVDAAGGLHAVWEESIGAEPSPGPAGHHHGPPKVGSGGRAVAYAHWPAGGNVFGPPVRVSPRPGVFQTRPAVVTAPGEVVIAWNELDESGKAVVVKRVPKGAEQ